MLGVGEFAGEIAVGSARVGVDIEAVSTVALVQSIREDAIRVNATTCRYAILNIIFINLT